MRGWCVRWWWFRCCWLIVLFLVLLLCCYGFIVLFFELLFLFFNQPSTANATPATQSEGRCHQVPRLPRKRKVDLAKYHACHQKWRSMSPSATPATQDEGRCRQAPRLPRKVARHAAATTAPTGTQARHQSQPSAIRAAPATQSDGQCHQVPRLPRKTKVDLAKYHACHQKWRSMSTSATPATQDEGRCHQVPRVPPIVSVSSVLVSCVCVCG